MERFPLNDQDYELIRLGLDVLARNFDDGVYHHTVGCALRCLNGHIYQGGKLRRYPRFLRGIHHHGHGHFRRRAEF